MILIRTFLDFSKIKLRKYINKSLFSLSFEFTYVLLSTFLPMNTDFKIITLSYLPYSMNMMLNANYFDFLFSEAHHRCGQEVTHGNLGSSSSTVSTDTALFLHPNITTTIQTINTHVSLIVNT
jgi:hypothetical protein